MSALAAAVDPWPVDGALGPACRYPLGALLFSQGDTVDTLYYIDEGIVRVTRSEAAGRDVVTGFRTRGWLLGAAAASLGRRHPVAAETLTTCTFRRLAIGDFRRLRLTNGSVVMWLQLMHAREVYESVGLVGMFGALGPRQRLERLIVSLIRLGHERRPNGSARLDLALKHHEIAQAIGTARESATRLLGKMEAEGLICRKGGWLLIPEGSWLLRAAVQADG
jgi:CRP-like cAMP-binding protein